MRDPEEVAAGPSLHGAIADDTTVGAVHLTVADVDRSIDYYRQAIGLEVLERADGGATVGAGTTELLVLDELPGARPADGYSGLYHFALRVPTRADLARWLAHAVRDRVALTGLSEIRITTGSRSTPTARASSGRATSRTGSRASRSTPTTCSASSTTLAPSRSTRCPPER